MAASPYTLDGAREILAGPDAKWLKRLDTALGIGILAAGPFGLVAWGWVDQKNELIKLLGQGVAFGRARLGSGRTPERQDVLAATHTALVYGAFFTAFREMVGPVYDEIGLTEDDKQRLAGGAAPDGLQRGLTKARIELPWAGCGFRANRDTVIKPFYEDLALRCIGFLHHFEAWQRIHSVRHTDPLVRDIVNQAVRRYEAEYKSLAAEVPEFGIWALLGESDATGRSLSRLAELVSSLSSRAGHRILAVNARLNEAVLEDSLVSTDDLGRLRIPTVAEGYLTPTFRWAVMDETCRPADDRWWETTEQGTDLDTFLAAYFTSSRSHDRPLVVLGLPGAGKSMFTKVCAARLSAGDAYAVARVPLRLVTDPTAPVHQQVSGVLDKTSNGRVSWTALTEAAADATRVLLIDGLDEFMQATGHAESSYLHNVAEFQRVERTAGQPVAVVVTSRTLVADLARIPTGSLVVKLNNFSADQVRACLHIWNEVNPDAQTAIPSAETILSYGEIAHQPLLLLLLILYGSTNPLPQVEADSTPAQIYGDILRRFIERELLKPPVVEAGEEQIRAELWRLGIAAFGMFNRGRHYIEEHLLLTDLDALDPSPRPRHQQRRGPALTAARQVLGRFFFIHAAEADEGAEGRSYEFLHATFSEYLIARLTVDELVELWESRDRPSSQQWDDDRLYALLSHQLLGIGGAAILPFIAQLHDALPDPQRRGVRRILRTLLQEAESRRDSGRFAAYSPSEGTASRRLAVYTANLVMVLLQVEEEPVPLAEITPAGEEPMAGWTRLVHLWKGCVPDFDLRVMTRHPREIAIMKSADTPTQPWVHLHWLMFRPRHAAILNAGYGAAGQQLSIGSHDPGIRFAGRAARMLVDPSRSEAVSELAAGIIRGWSGTSSDRGLLTLLIINVVRDPERFTERDIRPLMNAIGDTRTVDVDPWPYALLMAQYPRMVKERQFTRPYSSRLDRRLSLAPLLAGMLIWGDDVIPVSATFNRLPEALRGRIEECGSVLATLRHAVDERRLVLMAAELILRVLQEVEIGVIRRAMINISEFSNPLGELDVPRS
ncbi:hypothetical protein ACTI_65770 [Actinoplanes sp. OR16]|uniref:NACHT domain-containing protein n=1 Tax=Actinoplanes sp. OR16 TaxID=946334 RepID=UPI000F6CAE0F|nr:hypothetical protein [Actinoplanes sp. OR16]BBH69892.1 hypothetical protein ACTI_65770 [Actinoplanes sp. OR16]